MTISNSTEMSDSGIMVTAFTFSTSARYVVFIETLLLSFLLVPFRRISRPYFASWCVNLVVNWRH